MKNLTAEKNASPLGMFIYRIISGAFYRLGGLQLLKRKYKGDISERIGNVENIPENPVWVHAVSVGEVQSASSLIRRIKSLMRERNPPLTGMRMTGKHEIHTGFRIVRAQILRLMCKQNLKIIRCFIRKRLQNIGL